MTAPAPLAPLTGLQLRAAFEVAAEHLRQSARAIDAINVYPVPDGDTGSNMSATLRESVSTAAELQGEPAAAEVLTALARGALFGARGNSGVILSQALRGFANGVGAAGELDAAALAAGLAEAGRAAYSAVAKPMEGTMLTVLRIAGEAAVARAADMKDGGRHHHCLPVLGAAITAAEDAEAATMDQLPALREAGVPDSGGEGICTILRGLMAALTGAPLTIHQLPELDLESLADHDGFGFCTEFLLESATVLTREAVHDALDLDSYTSVVLVGENGLFRVHAHAEDPQPLLTAAETAGRLSRVKTEDMTAQHHRFEEQGSGAGAKVAVLALSAGPGFDQIFASLGVRTAPLGAEIKPAAGDIARAADALLAPDVIVLANHSNVILAAKQAVELARSTLHIVPTTTLPQGIAAALAFDPEDSATANSSRLAAAAEAIRSIEVTRAAADRRADGIDVREGQAIGMLDGRLVAASESLDDALLVALQQAGAEDAALVTLYSGRDISTAESEAAADRVRAQFPGAEVELIAGGQPLYPFIASVEL